MQIDTVLTLKNNQRILLLLKSKLENSNYFLAVNIDEKDEPTNNYVVVKEVIKDKKTFVKRIDDPLILNQLLEDFRIQYAENEFEEN